MLFQYSSLKRKTKLIQLFKIHELTEEGGNLISAGEIFETERASKGCVCEVCAAGCWWLIFKAIKSRRSRLFSYARSISVIRHHITSQSLKSPRFCF